MRKKIALVIITGLILVGTGVWGISVWRSNNTNVKEAPQNMQQPQEEEAVGMQKDVADEVEKNDLMNDAVEDGWKLYENDKYGFKLSYPDSWKLKIIDIPDSDGELYFFKKDDHNHFAVFPVGGFGHGIQEPRITYEKFKGKNAKMFNYDNYPFPNYIRILDNLPENWNADNDIEVVGEGKDNIKILKKILDSFQFQNNQDQATQQTSDNQLVWYQVPELGIEFEVTPDTKSDLKYIINKDEKTGEITASFYSESIKNYIEKYSKLKRTSTDSYSSKIISKISKAEQDNYDSNNDRPWCFKDDIVLSNGGYSFCLNHAQSIIFDSRAQMEEWQASTKDKTFGELFDTTRVIN